MYLTGFADEAAQDLATQIKATKELGWNAISARSIDGTSIHELSDKNFNKALKAFFLEWTYLQLVTTRPGQG